jgi:protein-disulfide isomerase
VTVGLRFAVTARDHALGEPGAPAQLVEYGDYECPYCAQAEDAVAQLRRNCGPRLLYVFRHFPLARLHPHALGAAMAAEAAALQGKFWEMHARLFEAQWNLANGTLLEIADDIGLDAATFASDLGTRPVQDRVLRDLFTGESSGVNGTPTFYVNGRLYEGPPHYEPLLAALEEALARPATRWPGPEKTA